LQIIQKFNPEKKHNFPEETADPIKKKFDFGIVISASHNPYTDNGIKIFDAQTGKISSEDEEIITNNFYSISQNQPVTTLAFQSHVAQWDYGRFIYTENILNHFSTDTLKKTGPYASKAIVLDCANGAAIINPFYRLTMGLYMHIQCVEPDGKNINDGCGATHPEFLQEFVVGSKANLGFAFDGDGDRIIAVNKYGQIKDGDDLLNILIQHPDYQHEKEIVGTSMTNHGFEKHLEQCNKKLIRTKVGDKYIAAKLEEKKLILGGETSGHIIIKNYLNTGDGVFVALKVLESIIINDNWEMKTFPKTPQFLINIPISKKKNLEQPPYATIIDNHKTQLIDGRIVVRYSGTENLLRIMVEDKTPDSAKVIAHQLSQQLKQALK